jgi:hypothetical protein
MELALLAQIQTLIQRRVLLNAQLSPVKVLHLCSQAGQYHPPLPPLASVGLLQVRSAMLIVGRMRMSPEFQA